VAAFWRNPGQGPSNNEHVRKTVVLLSGGLDSSTVLAQAVRDGFECHALTVLYGQRHAAELEAARRVAMHLGAHHHEIVQLPLHAWGGSSLVGDGEVPKDGLGSGIPSTYVPARNTVFLSLALGFAEVIGAFDIFIGVSAVDYSGYPDCRPEFIEAFQRLAQVATKAGVEGETFHIHAPLIHLTKAETIRLGLEMGVDYGMTHSCYDPGEQGQPCHRCDSCLLRAKAFAEAGVSDPLNAKYELR
jgi:7-cyano-7-deazaguanine synthase